VDAAAHAELLQIAEEMHTRQSELHHESRADAEQAAKQFIAATAIQSFMAFVVIRRGYLRLWAFTIIVQQRWRALLAGRTARAEVVQLRIRLAEAAAAAAEAERLAAKQRASEYRRAAQAAEAAAAAKLAAMRTTAATTIQCFARSASARIQLQALRSQAASQALARAQAEEAVTLIAAVWRGHSARNMVQRALTQRKQDAAIAAAIGGIIRLQVAYAVID
jgi:hypothetical protein